MTKFDDRKIAFICRHIVDVKDWTVSQVADQYEVSQTRVRWVTKKYRETGQIPKLDPSRRPKGPPLMAEEKAVIRKLQPESLLGFFMRWAD